MGMLTLMSTTNIGIMVLAAIGFIVAGYFIVQTFFANLSRYLLAASIDGVIPTWFSSTSRRFKSPVNALVGVLVVYTIFAIVMDIAPSNFAFWETVAIWTSGVLFLGTGLAGMFIPRTNKEMYKASPIARYPGLLVIAGFGAFLISGFVLIAYIVIPELAIGLGSLGGLIIVIWGALAVAWYEFFRAFQKRKGIDIGLAYKELPPE
jgi:amino acid transporter